MNLLEGAGTTDEHRFFRDGLTEDIAVELSRFRSLFGVARPEVEGAPTRPLPGSYAIGGTVRWAGKRLRVVIDLVDDTGAGAWSERYDRTVDSILAVQVDLARSIAATTAGRIMALATERARQKQPETAGPFEALALGLESLNRYTPADNRRARDFLERAVAMDPRGARAAAALASTYVYEWMLRPEAGTLDTAYDRARRALALDNADAWCHMIVGRVHLVAKRFELAEHFYERAERLNPNDTDILASHGIALAYLGRPAEGLARVAEAKRLNPYHPDWYDENRGFALFVAGRYEESLAALERIEDAPSWVHAMRGAAHFHLGGSVEAKRAIDLAVALDPTDRVSVYAATDPFRRPEDLARLVDGLRGAGLPE